ncbi:MAG TPA: hypothetical protein VGG39_23570 [Polyangiaceae bacterium]|jgi:hypothetical protein
MTNDRGTCGYDVTCRECDRDGEARCGLEPGHEGDHVPAVDVEVARLSAQLAAAVHQRDEAVRALLAVEWPRNGEKNIYLQRVRECPACLRCEDVNGEREHAPGCSTDAALTAAGLADRASRDDARAKWNLSEG